MQRLWLLLLLLLQSLLLPASFSQTLNASTLEQFVDELPQMPVLRAYELAGGKVKPASMRIGMFEANWTFHRDLPASRVFAYGTCAEDATVPGPTVEAMNGVPVDIEWQNWLPNKHILPVDYTIRTVRPRRGGVPTVVHLHGGVNEPASDGFALSWFTNQFRERGPTWTKRMYHYYNAQGPANLWYHDHAMGLTRVNILAGLSGAYIIRDPAVEEGLKLPCGSEYDRVLLLSDRDFNKDGSIYMNPIGNNPDIHPQWQPEYFGSVIQVNGKAWPFLRVQRRQYRFRIINTSNARFYELSLNSSSSSDDLRFKQVGSDAFYLPEVVSLSKILLAPSEIHDVIVDFSVVDGEGQVEVLLQNTANFPYPSGDPVDEETNGRVMKFIVEAGHSDASWPRPYKLLPFQKLNPDNATVWRTITLLEFVNNKTDEPTHLLINNKLFDDPVTELPEQGTTEVWQVINLTEDNHPVHVHLSGFQVFSEQKLGNVEELRGCLVSWQSSPNWTSTLSPSVCNLESYFTGRPSKPLKNERGWKNVYKMKPGYLTKLVVRWTITGAAEGSLYPFDPSAEPGYVYHCHMLDHEDNEKMRPFKLVL